MRFPEGWEVYGRNGTAAARLDSLSLSAVWPTDAHFIVSLLFY